MKLSESFSRELIHEFREQKECYYKGVLYSVRDNGAVFRHKSNDRKKTSKFDEVWTFGRKSDTHGYMMIGNHRVHIIVATAFYGPKDSKKYVVDHIDTNRCNNRVENLRWFTRLENALNNPVTRQRIEFLCYGDINRFIENPSCLRDLAGSDQNFAWMRTVTSEEAKNAYKRIEGWISKPKYQVSEKSGKLGEWIYTRPIINSKSSYVQSYSSYDVEEQIVFDSLTPNAKQKNWKTPTLFPLCPIGVNTSLSDYKNNLSIGEVVSRNQYSTSYIDEFEIFDDKLVIRSHADDGFKPYSVITISFENDSFIHEGITFFNEDGAKKAFTLGTGKKWSGSDSIDDYC